MARHNANANGFHAAGEVPPASTLAAQIVQHQTRPAVSQQSDQQTSFAHLLHQILHNSTADVEEDLSTNVSLVKVLVNVGLAVLVQDQPFAKDILLQQASDSISVIKATIKRQPGVLVAPITDDGPQVCIWLIARLAAIIGKPHCRDVPAAELLSVVLEVLSFPARHWRSALTFQEVIQESVHDVVTALENNDARVSFEVKVPPARCLVKFWPQADGVIAAPHDCQSTVHEPFEACMLALHLCLILPTGSTWRAEENMRIQRLAVRLRAVIKTLKDWETAIALMLENFELGARLRLLDDLLKDTMSGSYTSMPLQAALSRSLSEMLGYQTHLIQETLRPTLTQLSRSSIFPQLSQELKTIVVDWLARFASLAVELPGHVRTTKAAVNGNRDMTANGLSPGSRHRHASVHTHTLENGPRPLKRRRHRQENHESRKAVAIEAIKDLFEIADNVKFDTLPHRAPKIYTTLDKSQQYAAWRALKELAPFEPIVSADVASKLFELPATQDNKTARLLGMMAIQACVEASTEHDVVDLTNSMPGKACLQAMRSSSRDMRIAAGNCLPAFLRQSLGQDIRSRNRQTALHWARKLSDQDTVAIHDTLIPSWGHIARACDEAELNLVLLQLVGYLGHANSLTRALAFTEIQRIANARIGPNNTEGLLAPYWSSIAVSVVKELQSRPQKIQMLCDLLGQDVNTFLMKTLKYTLPPLVASKKRDVLLRLASARGAATSLHDLCSQPRANLTGILSHLLAQSGPEVENYAMECLTTVDPSFNGADLSDYVKIDSTAIACELLKHAGDQTDAAKPKAHHSFYVLAELCERGNVQRKSHSKPSRTIASFLRLHILGILTAFSSVIEAPNETASLREKVRCLKATAEMIVLAKEEVSAALPQIRALLQSAIDQSYLCEPAWSAWLVLLPTLEEQDTTRILEQTFALIIKHWSTFLPDTQKRTQETIAELVRKHSAVIHEHVMFLPSLSGIPLLSKIGGEIERLRANNSDESRYSAFTKRLQGDNRTVLLQALHELVLFLKSHHGTIHDAAISEQPSLYLSDLVRTLLDVTAGLAQTCSEAADLCGKALGLIGCLDPNRIEATRKKEHVLVLSNFETADEVVGWVVVLLETYLVKAFKSVTNTQAQGFMAYVMQELLAFCKFDQNDPLLRPRASQSGRASQRWADMPEHVRTTLTPFLSSKYTVTTNASFNQNKSPYAGFSPDISHSAWLRTYVYDLALMVKGNNAQILFPHLARIVRGHDLAIANFLLPYIVLNIVLGGTVGETQNIRGEMHAIFQCRHDNNAQFETVRLCSESLFGVLDYMSVWLQEKRKVLSETRANAFRTGQSSMDFDEEKDMGQIKTLEDFLASIPAEIVATRAMECGSFARALFNWEQFIRQSRPIIPQGTLSAEAEDVYDRLHDIYAQIDEPDGLEGISAHLSFLSEERQATLHAKSSRWTAAQAWYESKLANDSDNEELQVALLHSLRETGRHSTLLKYADGFLTAAGNRFSSASSAPALPFAVEATWMVNDIPALHLRLKDVEIVHDFSVDVGRLLIAELANDDASFLQQIDSVRRGIVSSMTSASTSSLQASHPDLKKLHLLTEMQLIHDAKRSGKIDNEFFGILNKRLEILGCYTSDKQSVLAVRRALLVSGEPQLGDRYAASTWLTSARLARKGGNAESAYHAVIQASEAGDRAAKLEEARLLWYDGHHRQAISAMEQAVASGVFDEDAGSQSLQTASSSLYGHKQNMLSAKAHLRLAKWLDASGQRQTREMTEKYQYAARTFQKWEKGHYHLGKHYYHLLEAEKALPRSKQTSLLLCGDLTKLVVDNLLRSVPFGNKYWHETIPKMLTLWLDLGMETQSKAPREDREAFEKRAKNLQYIHKQLRKYFDRIPPYIFYSALPQMLSRISHPHPEVWKELGHIITKIVATHPSQGLWSLMAVSKATDKLRQERGKEIMNRLRVTETRWKPDGPIDVRMLVVAGQRLSDGLLQASEAAVEPRMTSVSLSRDLGFNMKLAPCGLVVPIETALTINLPPAADATRIRSYRPFVQDKVTVQSFQEGVSVLSSLQRPKKVTVRGSDGKLYGLLCKPKDDLRKDQRLMEFNGIINRALKRDSEGSKRRLYIKTYAVTPLSEESGCLEWVEGIKPIRDILLNLYMRKGVRPNYAEIKNHLNEACKSIENVDIFTEKVQSQFPATLHEWFVEVYPEPETWFASRLRYARSAAVMSMTGHVLGLGDRHGENILLQESTGGVFHVDFNCLFDKGMTFEKPETVPFRLTQNMVDAMGPYGYEGPFRRSCEVTLGLLRQNKDTLMTVLETFLYDPTTDFVGKKKKTMAGVPETPREILDSVEGKLKGLLREETVPLSVEGYVDALIREAVSLWNLCQMYIGWCAFL